MAAFSIFCAINNFRCQTISISVERDTPSLDTTSNLPQTPPQDGTGQPFDFSNT